MASTKLKAAYVLFLFSFFVWLSVLLMVCFPQGTLSVPIRFTNYSMLMLFLGSGIVAAVSCSIIGLSYLDLGLKRGRSAKEISTALAASKTIPISQQAGNESLEEAEFQDSIPQEEPVKILVPELEEEQENK